ncbi:MAG: hypothetical protein IKB55_00960, partial [Clostridia bacterium]|nr:hypothetical protein [Clostridia bacterium]
MFDALGIIAFLLIIVCVAVLIASIFSRKINRKMWVMIVLGALVVFFASYGIDTAIEKNAEPPVIDFTGVTPDPTPTPEPTPTPTPELTEEPEEEVPSETEEETEEETTPED